jgi:rhodanese-related sulfurtransferase
MQSITVQELKQKRENNEEHQLIDVREPYEVDICTIDGENLPMGDIMGNMDKVRKDIPVVVHCRSGKRSAAVIEALERNGYSNLSNLEGGILAWVAEIDTSLSSY